MTDPTREAFDSDVDLMRDVYMLPSQREAYERILQAALSARAQWEAVAYMVRTKTGGTLCYPVSRERGVPEPMDGETVTPLYTATAVRAVEG